MPSKCQSCGGRVHRGNRCSSCRDGLHRASVTDVITQKIVLLFDLHIPEHDEKMFHAVLAFLAEFQPDEVILVGDFLELVSCSMHSFNEGMAVFDLDIQEGRRALQALRAAAPAARLTYLEGNHETRLQRFLMEKAPAMLSSVTLPDKLGFKELEIQWVPEGSQPISRGALDILHGHQIGTGGNYGLPKYHTAKAAAVYGQPGRRIVYGHVHYNQETGVTTHKGRATAKSFGCGRSLQPGWLRGSPSGWIHEFGIALLGPGGHTELYAVKPRDGRFIWDGKMYEGR